jgi:hypothetical protein
MLWHVVKQTTLDEAHEVLIPERVEIPRVVTSELPSHSKEN